VNVTAWDTVHYIEGMKKVYHGAMRGEDIKYKKPFKLSKAPTGYMAVTCPFCNTTFEGKKKKNECPFCGREF